MSSSRTKTEAVGGGPSGTKRRLAKTPPFLAQTVIDDLLELFYGNLSDEAVSHVANFLSCLALCFEETRFSQIRRYRSLNTTPLYPDIKPRQLDLFTDQPPF
jgi:hypothetical protein